MTPRLQKIEKSHEIVVSLMETLLEERKKKPLEEEGNGGPAPRDVASLMIRANESNSKSPMSDEELVRFSNTVQTTLISITRYVRLGIHFSFSSLATVSKCHRGSANYL
jgi:hypothetical protein